MSDDVIDTLVSRWQQLRQQGQSLSAAELCADRPELLTEVEAALSRLTANDSPDTIAPTFAPDDESGATVPPPVSLAGEAGGLGGYEILGELGRGGMGVVHKARQRKANRVVALKMILLGPGADQTRFRLEAEAIAKLQHPNVVQVFEVGDHDGTPYFTLEFCGGGSLDRKLNGIPLEPAVAATLVEKLARAMHHAHSRGVMHRDLKPANVLLTEDGTPKITDFGLAKFAEAEPTSGSAMTQTGAVMGTPSYMPPEQAMGAKEVGPPADVYSLGAILYDCVAGRPPFRAASTFDTLQQVVNQEPVPPRQLNPKVPRDLETVCLKCLHKDPARRYASAEALADDLRRILEDRPIVARPVSGAERAYRWGRRNPVLVALAALVALAMLGGTATSLFFGFRAQASARVAKNKADEAERNEERARTLAKLAGRQRSQTLQSYRTLTDEVLQKLRDTPEMQQLKQSLLRAAIGGLDKLDEDDAALDEDLTLAETYRGLAETLGRLGDREASRKAYRSALRIASRQAESSPEDDRAAVLATRAAVELTGQFGTNEADAVSAAKSAYDHAQALAARRPAPPEAGPLLIDAALALGECRLNADERKEAETLFAQALAQARTQAAARPDDREGQLQLARAAQASATGRNAASDWKAAAGHLKEAVELTRAQVKKKEDEPSLFALSDALTRHGIALERLNERNASEAAYGEAYQLLNRLIGDKPYNVEYRKAGLITQIALGRLSAADGDHGRTRAWLNSSLVNLRKAFADTYSLEHATVASYLHDQLADVSLRFGGKLAARNHLREGLRLVQGAAELNSSARTQAVYRAIYDTQMRIAALSAELGQVDVARADYADAIESAEKLTDADTRKAAATKKLAALPKSNAKSFANTIGVDMVLIPAGKYRRGGEEPAATVAEYFNKRYENRGEIAATFAPEHPAHEVRVSKAFYVGAAEVTRGQFLAFVKATGYRSDAEKDGKGFGNFNPNAERAALEYRDWRMSGRLDLGDDHPVAGVSWNDAVAFCAWLSKKEGKTYRLPTDAEWEYACRAGTTTRYVNGDDPQKLHEVANVPDRSFAQQWKGRLGYESLTVNDGFADVSPVGSFAPNAWGLYDVHGNVWEWCADGFDPKAYEAFAEKGATDPAGPGDRPTRVMRGGCFM